MNIFPKNPEQNVVYNIKGVGKVKWSKLTGWVKL